MSNTPDLDAIHDAALRVHTDGGRELARLVIESMDDLRAAVARAEAAEARNAGVVSVCPICDIAGCKHIRAALKEGGG